MDFPEKSSDHMRFSSFTHSVLLGTSGVTNTIHEVAGGLQLILLEDSMHTPEVDEFISSKATFVAMLSDFASRKRFSQKKRYIFVGE